MILLVRKFAISMHWSQILQVHQCVGTVEDMVRIVCCVEHHPEVLGREECWFGQIFLPRVPSFQPQLLFQQQLIDHSRATDCHHLGDGE
jgi:hypothetical protein